LALVMYDRVGESRALQANNTGMKKKREVGL
jgi:hypothetical protein